MPSLIASALVAGFLVMSGAQAASAPAEPITPALPTLSATLTSYNAVPAQTDGDPMTTASGLRSNPEVIAARSNDLAKSLPYGTVIAIERDDADSPTCGYGKVSGLIGYRVIGDAMNARMHDRVDVLLDTKVKGMSMNPSRVLGVCNGTTIKIVGYMKLSDVPATQEELAEMVEQSNLALN
jgi:3D (Asp-Asp-Asp) domain-containing protein